MEVKEQCLDQDGYWRFKETGLLVHRVAYEAVYGRIPHRWVIHHVDGNKTNNAITNLISLHRDVHDAIHQTWPKGQLPSRLEIMLWSRVLARFNRSVSKGLNERGQPIRKKRQSVMAMNREIKKRRVMLRKKGVREWVKSTT